MGKRSALVILIIIGLAQIVDTRAKAVTQIVAPAFASTTTTRNDCYMAEGSPCLLTNEADISTGSFKVSSTVIGQGLCDNCGWPPGSVQDRYLVAPHAVGPVGSLRYRFVLDGFRAVGVPITRANVIVSVRAYGYEPGRAARNTCYGDGARGWTFLVPVNAERLKIEFPVTCELPGGTRTASVPASEFDLVLAVFVNAYNDTGATTVSAEASRTAITAITS
jgi:hypothetical protein